MSNKQLKNTVIWSVVIFATAYAFNLDKYNREKGIVEMIQDPLHAFDTQLYTSGDYGGIP